MQRTLMRLLGFGAPVAVGLAALTLAIFASAPPERAPPEERARAVRVLDIAPTRFTPAVVGYGPAAPSRTWSAVAQVAGRIDFVHPRLSRGALLPAGLEILRIEAADYELALAEAEANLSSAEAQLVELEIEAENAERSLTIERRALDLKAADLNRVDDLVRRGTSAQAALDDAERDLLTQQARVQDLENTLRLSPTRLEAQRKRIEVEAARVQTAELNLERTRVRLPFDVRVSEKSVEEAQFVSVGTTLAQAYGVDAVEIDAQIPQLDFARFLTLAAPDAPQFASMRDAENRAALRRLGIMAEVRLSIENQVVTWPATLLRTSDTIDAETRAVGAIVSVADPYDDIKIGVRPPLVRGMFVEVELSAPPIEDQIVAPRSSVRDGVVYVVDADNRLAFRDVEVRAIQGAQAVIASGLSAGDRLVLSDLAPAIEGMLLAPTVVDAPGREPQ